MRVVVVAVVVRELLFVVMSMVCVQTSGCRSEVTTTPYHFCPDFCLQQRSYQSGLVALAISVLCYVNIQFIGVLCSLAP